MTDRRRWYVFLFAVAVVTLGAGLGLRDPWPADEPRFALVAREMVATGDWLFPHRNGELYADKPPLAMWLIALAYQTTGNLRVAFLLPSLLAGLATLALVVDLSRRLWGARPALAAGAVLLISFQFVWQSRNAQIDALLVGWTTLGLYGLARHLLLGPAWGWCAIAFLAMGCGVISKGVGFLPVLALLPWAVARWRGAHGLARVGADWRWLVALLLVVPIAAWLVPMLQAVSASGDPALAAYRDNILFKQTARRYAAPSHHFKPPWYYLSQCWHLWAPLSVLLPWAIPAWWRRIRRGDARQQFLLGWVLLVFVFFSVSPGKRGVYIYPALPALAVALAPLLPGLLRRRDVRIATLALALLVSSALLVAGGMIISDLVPAYLSARAAAEGVDSAILRSLALPALLAGGVAAGWIAWTRVRRGPLALAGTLVIGWIVAASLILPRLNPARQPGALMARADALVDEAGALGMVRFKEQYALMAPRGLVSFGYQRRDIAAEMAEAAAWLRARPGRVLLVPADELAHAPVARERLLPLGGAHGDEWFAARAEALTQP